MKHGTSVALKGLWLLCAAALCLGSLSPAALWLSASAADNGYVKPGYVVDFSGYDAMDGCYDIFNVTPTPEDGAMVFRFTDTGGGNCFDPYLSLSLDTGKYSCEEYPYLALLVKTNKQDLKGQLRFRTPSTGNNYPCQEFTYQKTDDWQVVVIHITNRQSLLFYP